MDENIENKKLYWYGFWANIKRRLGAVLIFAGVIVALIIFLSKHEYGLWSLVIPLLLWVAGLWLFFKGKEEKFDFEKQSGIIVNIGDKT